MKVMFISDIHISNYMVHAELQDNNMTNRLKLFLTLAQDSYNYAIQNKVRVIVIGGDLLDKAKPTPEEMYVAKQFINILSQNKDIKIIIINGNHDLSVKIEDYSGSSSIVTTLVESIPNIHYIELNNIIEIDGITFDCQSWRLKNKLTYKQADVLVAHGAIIGSSTSDGFLFEHGFDTKDLFGNYRLSLCGDIHKPKLFENVDENGNNQYAIQSGTLMQNSYGDDLEAGFWVIDINKNTVSKPLFIHNDQLEHGSEYYKFITLDNVEDLPLKEHKVLNRPTRVKQNKKSKKKQLDNTKQQDNISLQDKFKELVADNENKDTLIDLFENMYNNSTESINRIPQGINLSKINISNFLSIKELNFDFLDVPNQLILGKTGSGKTTLMSAVFFALTGKINKNQSPVLQDLVNYHCDGKETMEVKLEFTKDDKHYEIQRSYVKKAQVLDFIINGTSVRANSISNTQALIYDIIGVDDKELFTFSYHSVKGNSSFTDLGNADRYEIISKIAQIDKLDSMRDYLKTLAVDINTQKNTLDGSINQLNTLLTQKVQLRDSILLKKESSNVDVIEIQKQLLINETTINNLNLTISELNTVKQQSNLEFSKISNLEQQDKMLNMQRTQLVKRYNENTIEIRALQDSKCSKCGQHWEVEDVEFKIKTLQDAIIDITNQGKEVKVKIDTNKVAWDELLNNYVPFDDSGLNTLNIQLKECVNKVNQCKSILQSNDNLIKELAQLDFIEQDIISLEEQLKDKAPLLQDTEYEMNIYKEMSKLIDKRSSFIGELLQNACDKINEELSYVMSDLIDFKAYLQMDKEIDIMVDIMDRKSVPLITLSAGQTKIVQIAILVAFLNVYSNMYGLSHGLLGYVFLDEIYGNLDQEILEYAKPLVDKSVARQVIITHEVSLQTLYPCKMLVENIKGFSHYESC